LTNISKLKSAYIDLELDYTESN